jgi:hypothetical protein
MQEPTIDMRGSALGDYVGISWLLHDVDDTRLVGHGGTTNGQYSAFVMVPSRKFALISMTNCGPNGSNFNNEIEKWCLEQFAGVVQRDPEPIRLSDEALVPYTGRYETIAATCEITIADGRLAAKIEIKPEARAVLQESGEEVPPDQPPVILGLLSADGDAYVVAEGDAKGMKGYFARNAEGAIDGVHLGGRLAKRVAAVP